MKYPTLLPEEWANAKLSAREREEIDYMVNHANISIKQVAKQYNVCPTTVRYWSDKIYRRISIDTATDRKNRQWRDPVTRDHIRQVTKNRFEYRIRTDVMFRAWTRGKKDRNIQTNENDKRLQRIYYIEHKEASMIRSRRSRRAKNLCGFRMFMKRVEV